MKNKFSLVVATYGRDKEIDNFLNSIKIINYDLSKVEIIIVDQNNKIELNEIIEKYNKYLNIIHIKSDLKGLALNRNIGLKKVTGDIIAFPDDDCEYLSNTLEVVNNYFNNNKEDVIMGRIVERDGKDSLRVWSKEKSKVTKSNFYTKCSSITMFLRKSTSYVMFNERLGAGQYFGACEDADLIFNNLKRHKKIMYYPDIKIYHPHYESGQNMDEKKVFKYGLGFGAFIKSNIEISTMYLFLKAELYHLFKALIHILRFNLSDSKMRWIAFKSRILGFIKYK